MASTRNNHQAKADARQRAERPLRHRQLAKLRTALPLSQYALAVRIGVTQSAISQWEAGRAQPTTEHLGKLARVFKVPIEDLVHK